jgi:hypothetical protein
VIAPKVGEQYVNNVTRHANHITSDQQSSSIELYSEGGRDEVLESSNYLMPWDANSTQNINGNNTFNNNGGMARDNGIWTQFLSEDLLNLPTSSSSFPNYASTPNYPPSKVLLLPFKSNLFYIITFRSFYLFLIDFFKKNENLKKY